MMVVMPASSDATAVSLRAQIHVERAILRAQCLGDDVDIGEEVVNIGHHAPHHAEPHMMMGVDEARHDDRVAGVDDFGVVGLDVGADGNDAVALDEDVAGLQVRDIGDPSLRWCRPLKRMRVACCVLILKSFLKWFEPVLAAGCVIVPVRY